MPLERKHQKIFAKNADGTDLSIVGSKSQDNPQYSTDVEEIQSLSNWLTGLRSQVTSSDAPYLQDQNSIFYVITSQLAYLFQAGVAEWNSQTEYVANRSLVLRNGKFYLAIANSTNIEPEVTAGWESYWQNLLSWSKIVGAIYNQTDLWNIILNDGLVFNSTVASAIGGYPLGAILNYTDGNGNIIKIKSLVNNNTNEPNASNIKTALNPSGSKWEAVSNKFTQISIKGRPMFVDDNNVFHIDSPNIAFLNIGGFAFDGTDPNGTFYINFKNVQVQGNPIIRLPDYSNRTSIASDSTSDVLTPTISNDGWIFARAIYPTAFLSIANNGLINENDVNLDHNSLVTIFVPVKAGDYLRCRRCVVYFYPYR